MEDKWNQRDIVVPQHLTTHFLCPQTVPAWNVQAILFLWDGQTALTHKKFRALITPSSSKVQAVFLQEMAADDTVIVKEALLGD